MDFDIWAWVHLTVEGHRYREAGPTDSCCDHTGRWSWYSAFPTHQEACQTCCKSLNFTKLTYIGCHCDKFQTNHVLSHILIFPYEVRNWFEILLQ